MRVNKNGLSSCKVSWMQEVCHVLFTWHIHHFRVRNSHLLPWQSSYGFNKNMLKVNFFSFFYSIVVCLVCFIARGIWGKNYIQELISGCHAILWGLLEFTSWKCLVHTLLHRKRSTIFKLTFCTVQHKLY